MNRTARYMMMRNTRERDGDMRRNEHTRTDHGGMTGNYARYDGGMENRGGYEPETRFRDSRGREHYDNGRYAPRNVYMPDHYGGDDIESRRGQRRGRDGRFRAEDNGGMRSHYDDDDEEYRMNTIGFGNRDMPEPIWQEGGARVEHGGGTREMERRSGTKEHGGAYGHETELTPDMAHEWTKAMHNGDKTNGAHWTMEQTKQLAQQRNISADPVEFYAVVNAMYSDFCEVAKKHNVHNADFYVDLAKAWLKDPDAVPNKAAMYYEYVVKHDD